MVKSGFVEVKKSKCSLLWINRSHKHTHTDKYRLLWALGVRLNKQIYVNVHLGDFLT